jgi:hypothetical protein
VGVSERWHLQSVPYFLEAYSLDAALHDCRKPEWSEKTAKCSKIIGEEKTPLAFTPKTRADSLGQRFNAKTCSRMNG